MKKIFKIGEISKLYHIGTDSLRYYEKIGILAPKRDENGYRIYSIDDIWRLNVIRDLRELNFPMERIGMYLQDRTVDITTSLLREELEIIQKKMHVLQVLQKNVVKRIEMMEQSKNELFDQIVEKQIKERNCQWIPEGYKEYEEMDVLIKQLTNLNPEKLYIIGSNSIGSMIPLSSAIKGEYRDYQAVFMIDDEGNTVIKGGTYLTIRYHGESGKNKIFLPQLLQYAVENQYIPQGDVLEILWIDIHASANVEEHISELQLHVIPKPGSTKKKN